MFINFLYLGRIFCQCVTFDVFGFYFWFKSAFFILANICFFCLLLSYPVSFSYSEKNLLFSPTLSRYLLICYPFSPSYIFSTLLQTHISKFPLIFCSVHIEMYKARLHTKHFVKALSKFPQKSFFIGNFLGNSNSCLVSCSYQDKLHILTYPSCKISSSLFYLLITYLSECSSFFWSLWPEISFSSH